jgi:hypothetical protein
MKSQTLVTRPADTTPYGAGDVVGGAFKLLDVSPLPGGEVLITSASLRVDVTSVPAGMTTFRLHLYSVTPPSALADNAVWDLPAGDRASYQGYIDLGTPVDVGSTLWVQTDKTTTQGKWRLGTGETAFYCYLVTAAAYTPSSAAVKAVAIDALTL